MSFKDVLKKEPVKSLLTILLSGVISFIVSTCVSNHEQKTYLKLSIFKDEVPVLNRVSSIWSECQLYCVTVIGIHDRIETQILYYVTPDREVVKTDTVSKTITVGDTTDVYLPKFMYKRESNVIVREDIEYITHHLDALSPETYPQVMNLLDFERKHPIVYEEDDETRFKSEWSTQSVYSEFFEIIGSIYASYSKRQQKYLE